MKTILCFGDSNTYGTKPMATLESDGRFEPSHRWPCVVEAKLGDDFQIIAEGLPGRTTVWDDPIEGTHRNGARMIVGLIESHRPIDLLVIMLGTNDHKMRFSVTAQDIALGARRLVDLAMATGHVKEILLISPPEVLERGCLAQMFTGAEKKTAKLARYMQMAAQSRGVHSFDAASVIESDPLDGVHFSGDAQIKLGEAIAGKIEEIFSQTADG